MTAYPTSPAARARREGDEKALGDRDAPKGDAPPPIGLDQDRSMDEILSSIRGILSASDAARRAETNRAAGFADGALDDGARSVARDSSGQGPLASERSPTPAEALLSELIAAAALAARADAAGDHQKPDDERLDETLDERLDETLGDPLAQGAAAARAATADGVTAPGASGPLGAEDVWRDLDQFLETAKTLGLGSDRSSARAAPPKPNVPAPETSETGATVVARASTLIAEQEAPPAAGSDPDPEATARDAVAPPSGAATAPVRHRGARLSVASRVGEALPALRDGAFALRPGAPPATPTDGPMDEGSTPEPPTEEQPTLEQPTLEQPTPERPEDHRPKDHRPKNDRPTGGEAMGGEAMGGEATGGEATGGEAMGGEASDRPKTDADPSALGLAPAAARPAANEAAPAADPADPADDDASRADTAAEDAQSPAPAAQTGARAPTGPAGAASVFAKSLADDAVARPPARAGEPAAPPDRPRAGGGRTALLRRATRLAPKYQKIVDSIAEQIREIARERLERGEHSLKRPPPRPEIAEFLGLDMLLRPRLGAGPSGAAGALATQPDNPDRDGRDPERAAPETRDGPASDSSAAPLRLTAALPPTEADAAAPPVDLDALARDRDALLAEASRAAAVRAVEALVDPEGPAARTILLSARDRLDENGSLSEPDLDAIAQRAVAPILSQWLNAHLPAMVEHIVRAEIARAFDRG